MTEMNSGDTLCMYTGAHFNRGEKFYNFSHILTEDSTQEEVF